MQNNSYNSQSKTINQTPLIVELIQLRKDSNLTQKELAKNVRLTQSQISKMEQETTSPRLSTLIKVADYFKKTITLN